jgi:hypothetical protein
MYKRYVFKLVFSEGLCDNDDKNIWDNKRNETKDTLNSCGTTCWGEAECVGDCMKNKLGFSKQCSSCFGTFSECGKSNCIGSCALCRTCKACIDCMKKYCESSFLKCSGITSPL